MKKENLTKKFNKSFIEGRFCKNKTPAEAIGLPVPVKAGYTINKGIK